ncbi:MAG TPA: hypothetical protein VM925_18375, partial [Labilithrix sp.]|nr:hypothetical protein [Labilithrix sp.]
MVPELSELERLDDDPLDASDSPFGSGGSGMFACYGGSFGPHATARPSVEKTRKRGRRSKR